MYEHSDDEFLAPAEARRARHELHVRRRRCTKLARLSLALGTAGVLLLSLIGLGRPALAIPAFLTTACLVLVALSATLLAWVARLEMSALEDGFGDDDDDEGPGPGDGVDGHPDPPGAGGRQVDWAVFEREFRLYCEKDARALIGT